MDPLRRVIQLYEQCNIVVKPRTAIINTDVREEHEYDEANLNGELIPMGEIMFNTDKISKDKPVILHCRTGVRSGTIISALEKQYGFTNLYNLKGGIKAWAAEIDTSITVN